MIYQRQFLKETTITAIAVFVVILAILVFTQGITLLGRAAGGNVAIDAVGTLIGFWVLNLAPHFPDSGGRCAAPACGAGRCLPA